MFSPMEMSSDTEMCGYPNSLWGLTKKGHFTNEVLRTAYDIQNVISPHLPDAQVVR